MQLMTYLGWKCLYNIFIENIYLILKISFISNLLQMFTKLGNFSDINADQNFKSSKGNLYFSCKVSILNVRDFLLLGIRNCCFNLL